MGSPEIQTTASEVDDATSKNAGNEEFELITPLVIEMGKISKKKLKKFKKGKGALVDEVIEVLGEVVGGIAGETESRTIVPVVMVYEKKPKKKLRLVLPFL